MLAHHVPAFVRTGLEGRGWGDWSGGTGDGGGQSERRRSASKGVYLHVNVCIWIHMYVYLYMMYESTYYLFSQGGLSCSG